MLADRREKESAERKMSSTSLATINGGILPSTSFSSFSNLQSSPKVFLWGLRRDMDAGLVSLRNKSQAFRILANSNVSPARVRKEIIMVDPLEAKQLAAKQMTEIKAREKFKRRRQAEAINGAWAMIGLTAGLVIEGETGNSILSQLAGYWAALISLFVR